MNTANMKNLESPSTSELVLFGNDAYLRMNYTDQNKAVWLLCSAAAFTMVDATLANTLEAHYVGMSVKSISDEELEDALCEQMASDDYEASVYA
tara:strand:- start:542 stop:823 length:282 start_codon:yes stop_codon:yes gene_type:complete